MAATKSTTTKAAPAAKPAPEPVQSKAQEAAAADKTELDETSTVKTEVDPDKSADPGEIKTGVSAAEIPASGAISEKEAVADIPVDHPAVDDNPRKRQPAEANRIDFNDPSY